MWRTVNDFTLVFLNVGKTLHQPIGWMVGSNADGPDPRPLINCEQWTVRSVLPLHRFSRAIFRRFRNNGSRVPLLRRTTVASAY